MASATGPERDELEPAWSWRRYFTQVTAFFESMERQTFSSPNRNYTEYVVGSLEVLWRNLNSIKEYIGSQSVSEEHHFAMRSLLVTLQDLIDLLPPLASAFRAT